MVKKIAIDARSLRSTTGRYTRELLNSLEKLDSKNEYHIIVNPEDDKHWKSSKKNFHKHIVPYKHYTFSEQIGFLHYLNMLEADLVHFTMPQQPILYRKPHVTTIHDLTLVKWKNANKNQFIYSIKQLVFKYVIKRVAKTSETVITISESSKSDIVEYCKVSENKIVVTYPAANAMSVKSKTYKPAEGKEYIVYVGNCFPYKNIDRLIEAHQKLLVDHEDLYLLIVGKKDDNTAVLERLVEENYYDKVIFTDFIDDSELAWVYANAKAYVFPSTSEGFGLPGLEAMFFDIPVVSSDATSLPEVYEDAAQYFDPENVLDMQEAIDRVITNEDLADELVKKGKKQRNKYSWSEMGKKTHDIYKEILK